MSAHCISCRLESEKTCLLALHFTCINRKVGCLICTHSLTQFWCKVSASGGIRGMFSQGSTLWFILYLASHHGGLSLLEREFFQHCTWLLESTFKFLLLCFLPQRGFPRINPCVLCALVYFSKILYDVVVITRIY